MEGIIATYTCASPHGVYDGQIIGNEIRFDGDVWRSVSPCSPLFCVSTEPQQSSRGSTPRITSCGRGYFSQEDGNDATTSPAASAASSIPTTVDTSTADHWTHRLDADSKLDVNSNKDGKWYRAAVVGLVPGYVSVVNCTPPPPPLPSTLTTQLNLVQFNPTQL